MEMARKIAEIKYPKEEGWKHAWVFNHSSCHAAMADDELDASKMNVRPGGKQRLFGMGENGNCISWRRVEGRWGKG